MRKANALGLGHQPEEHARPVEAPGPALFDDREALLVVSVEQLVADLACRVLVSQFEGFRAKLLRVDHADQAVRENSLDRGIRPKVFKSTHFGETAPSDIGH